ncbi:DNA-binding response regulator [Streptosporangium saharense]|uniref:DNA-binding response regulator n=1 Tax=Streptosporangium saharense TaxID=1706840 RepID=UPI0036C845A8
MDQDRNVTLRGERELTERAGHLLLGARHEFACAAGDLLTWSLPGMRARIPSDHGSLTVRKLFDVRLLADEEGRRHLDEAARRGALVRISTTGLPYETIIVDGRLAVLAGPPGPGERSYTVVRSPGVVANVNALFLAAWNAAADLAEFRSAPNPPPVLDEEGRRVLAMLGSGRKDEAAARELGLSLRTYRRRVAALMRLLDADSRFEAGLRARELGFALAQELYDMRDKTVQQIADLFGVPRSTVYGHPKGDTVPRQPKKIPNRA